MIGLFVFVSALPPQISQMWPSNYCCRFCVPLCNFVEVFVTAAVVKDVYIMFACYVWLSRSLQVLKTQKSLKYFTKTVAIMDVYIMFACYFWLSRFSHVLKTSKSLNIFPKESTLEKVGSRMCCAVCLC